MKKSWVVAGAVLFLGGLLAVPAARAQRAPVTKEQLDAFGASFKQAQTFYNKLTPTQQNMLSGSALNLFHVMNNWPQVEREALRAQDLIQRRGSQTPHIPTLPPISPGLRFKFPAFNQPSPIGAPVGTTSAPVNVTDTSKNFIYSASGGFTQNETSTAWCGTQVVVGFNDSGSVFESGFATGFSALSINGYGTSSNQGTTDYTDQGFLPSAGPGLSFPFLGGDPVVACTSATNFFYSSILSTNGLAAISVSHSTNGGVTWGSPIIAAAVSAFSGFLDKPWMAVNPANPMQIAVSYTNFQTFFGSCGSSTMTISIDVVMSTDGGTSWSAPPTTVFKTCGGTGSTNDPFVQGSQVAFSPNGTLDVAFEFFPEGFAGGRQILFATPFASIPGFNLNNLGIVPVTTAIDNITGTGDGFQLAGGFRNFIDFQGIAVDSSGTATNGNIYIVWQDTDPTDSERSFNGIEYEYSDIFISVSTNGGASWSPPVKVNTNTETPTSQFDSYLPSVAVDQTSGSVGVCWYDRRNDPSNYFFQRFCGKSTNAGASFTNFAQTNANFQPIHATDNLINNAYMGDYDTLATDVLKTTSGFIGAFQVVFPAGTFGANLVPNPIVRARNFD